MTPVEARTRARDAIRNATRAFRGIRVSAREGVVDGAEIRRMATHVKGVQVAAVRTEGGGVRVAAYVVDRTRQPAAHQPDTDGGTLDLVKAVEGALRSMPGDRPALNVRSQTLYDAKMMESGGVTLWAVVADVAPLALVVPDTVPPTPSLAERFDTLIAGALDGALGTATLSAEALGLPADATDAQIAAARRSRRGETVADRIRLDLDGPLPSARIEHGRRTREPSADGLSRYEQNDLAYQARMLGLRWPVVVTIFDARRADGRAERLASAVPSRQWEIYGQAYPIALTGIEQDYSAELGAQTASVEWQVTGAVPYETVRVHPIRRSTINCEVRRRMA